MESFLARIGRYFEVDLNIKRPSGRHFAFALLATAALAGALVVLTSPWKAFAIVAGLAVFALAFYRPEWVIIFLGALIPFEPFLLKFVSDEIYVYARYFSESLVYMLLLSVAVRLLVRQKRVVATPLDLPFLFFLLVAASSLVINFVSPVTGFLGLRQIIRFVLLFFLVVYLDPDRAFIKRFSYIMLGIVLFQGLLGGLQSLIGGPLDELLIPSERRFFESIQLTTGTTQFWSPGTRVFATMGRYDQLGTFLCFFFLIIVGWLYYSQRDKTRQGLLAVLLLAFPGFVMTLSRASWFGFLLGVLVIGGLLMKDVKVRLAFAGFLVVVLAYLGYTGIVVRYLVDYPGQTPIERFFEAFSYERWRGEYYGLGRMFWIVQTPLTVVRSSPLFGVGPGQYGGGAAAALGNTKVYEQLNLPFGVSGTEGYIDNNWFSIWGETGTLGLGFYLWMYIALALVALRVWRRSRLPFTRGLALGYFGCLLAVALQAFLATYLEVRTLAMYLWLYGAFLYVLGRHEKIYA
ncbi:MAG: hypothetical protein WCT10_01905 [Patescibacteria group bacterium]|jgi:hypothetical protein